MAFVKGKDTAKYFRNRARELVKGKGRLLTFALVIPETVPGADGGFKENFTPTIRAYYGALGGDGTPAVLFEEETV